MLTFRRALAVAAVILTCFLVLRNTHTSYSEAPLVHNSPKPTGSYHDNKVIQDTPPEPASTGMGTGTGTESAKPASTGAAWNGDNGGRVALAKKPLTQLPLEDLKALPIRKQLSYAFPYDAEGKFPAYIWQTWKYTPASGEFSETFRPAEASWTGLHPAFVHEVITDEIAGHLVKHFYATVPEVVEAYNSLPIPVMKADFFRYLILLARGGIYSDIDTTALKSAVEWVPAEVPRSTYGLARVVLPQDTVLPVDYSKQAWAPDTRRCGRYYHGGDSATQEGWRIGSKAHQERGRIHWARGLD